MPIRSVAARRLNAEAVFLNVGASLTASNRRALVPAPLGRLKPVAAIVIAPDVSG